MRTTTETQRHRETEKWEPRRHAKEGEEKWLLNQNPGFYTLQVIGVRDDRNMGGFINKYGLWNAVKFTSVHPIYQNGNWNILLYGIYPSLYQAMAAQFTILRAICRRVIASFKVIRLRYEVEPSLTITEQWLSSKRL